MYVQRFTLSFMCVSRGHFVELTGTRIPEMSVSPTAHKSNFSWQVELREAPKRYSLHTLENAVHLKK